MEQKVLENIGLTKSEAKVYIALLELGSSTRTPIIEKARIASSKVYELLNKLMEKGLVSLVIKNNVKYFEAAPASRILQYLNEKENNLKEQINDIKNILPELELKQKSSKEKSEISVYKSTKGIETIFSIILDSLKNRDEYYAFGAIAGGINQSQRSFLIKHHKRRIERQINLKIIFHKGIGYLQKEFTKMKFAEIKYMDPRLMGPAETLITKDKVIIILWKEAPLGIIMDNKEIAENYKKYFDFLWDLANK